MERQIFPRMHVSLYVSNLEASINFYESFFGQPADKIRKGYAKYILDKPSLTISFVENKERVQQNFGHLGFQVETLEELEKHLTSAKEHNLVNREEIGTSCCFAKQDKFWVNDPDGIQWEVYYFHADAEFNDPHYQEESSEACCMASTATIAKKEEPNEVLEEACCPSCDCN